MNRWFATLALVLLAIPTTALRAQESNDEWLDDCLGTEEGTAERNPRNPMEDNNP